MIRKIMSAVEYMHRQGIVHRDLKPENLLLTEKGPRREVKIIDFGLSKLLGAEVETTQSFLGTRGYLAPEMLKRQADISAMFPMGRHVMDEDQAQPVVSVRERPGSRFDERGPKI